MDDYYKPPESELIDPVASFPTKDGWLIYESELYELLANQTPRKNIYLSQFINDLKPGISLILILTSITVIIHGAYYVSFYSLASGMLGFGMYLRMFIKVTYDYVYSPVLIGKITSLQKQHPMIKKLSTTTVTTDDGKTVPVAILTHPTKELLEKYEEITIKFLYCPKAEYSQTLAVSGE